MPTTTTIKGLELSNGEILVPVIVLDYDNIEHKAYLMDDISLDDVIVHQASDGLCGSTIIIGDDDSAINDCMIELNGQAIDDIDDDMKQYCIFNDFGTFGLVDSKQSMRDASGELGDNFKLVMFKYVGFELSLWGVDLYTESVLGIFDFNNIKIAYSLACIDGSTNYTVDIDNMTDADNSIRCMFNELIKQTDAYVKYSFGYKELIGCLPKFIKNAIRGGYINL